MMKKQLLTAILMLAGLVPASKVTAQEILFKEAASLEQMSEESQEWEELPSMNDLGMDAGGYALYETQVTVSGGKATLEIENVRDYAVVCLDGETVGELDNDSRSLTFQATDGTHTLQLYAENIGRITYGPEILDNSKGLFGTATLDAEPLTGWIVTPLAIHACDGVDQLNFGPMEESHRPCFYRGTFTAPTGGEWHLDIRGWGMGEVWLNGEYLGTYWEQNAQQSLPVPASMLKNGENTLIVFDLKNNGKRTMKLTDKPIFN